MGLGLHGRLLSRLGVSHECELQDVASSHVAKDIVPVGSFCMAMEFMVSRLRCHLQITGWWVLRR